MMYCIYEGNDKNVFGKKMKKNNFHKNVIIGEDVVYCRDVEEDNDNIGVDYADYDYFSDLV